jgi:hypothetical protein
LLPWLGVLLACCGPARDVSTDFGAGAFTVSGTMTRLAIEGGCWQFKSDDGTNYEVSGEQADELRKDGQRAEIIVREIPTRRTICMTGKSVELLKVLKLH